MFVVENDRATYFTQSQVYGGGTRPTLDAVEFVLKYGPRESLMLNSEEDLQVETSVSP